MKNFTYIIPLLITISVHTLHPMKRSRDMFEKSSNLQTNPYYIPFTPGTMSTDNNLFEELLFMKQDISIEMIPETRPINMYEQQPSSHLKEIATLSAIDNNLFEEWLFRKQDIPIEMIPKKNRLICVSNYLLLN